MPSVNIITRNNGGGLSQDISLLSSALSGAGASIRVLDVVKDPAAPGRWRLSSDAPATADLNVMIETVVPEMLRQASVNVYVPNPEHIDLFTWGMLCEFDAVWTKTAHAARLFLAVGLRTDHIGFTSTDRRAAPTHRREFLHLSSSIFKGTDRLIETWSRNPAWPELTVVYNDHLRNPSEPAPNVHLVPYLSDRADLIALQNRCRFHLCPSETEGWGHCMVEALSVESVVITVDAPPMNELVNPDRGLLVEPDDFRQLQGMAMRYKFRPESLTAAVEWCLSASDEELAAIGRRARNWYEANDGEFRRRVSTAFHRLSNRFEPG